MNEPTQPIQAPASLREYRLPVDLLQAVVNYLNTRPCIEVRALMNAIEAESVRQDQEQQAGRDAAQ